MKIRTKIDLVPEEDLYALRFMFEDLTDEEKYLFTKYGFISVFLSNILVDLGPGRGRSTVSGRHSIDAMTNWRFLFDDKNALKNFEKEALTQIQTKLKSYIEDLSAFAGEDVYEVSAFGQIQKINEGARKALDKNSKEYKEFIEKNREAFEKLSKL